MFQRVFQWVFGSFFGCLLVRAVGFWAFFYDFAVLALLSAVILFFVGPVGGFWAVFPGKF